MHLTRRGALAGAGALTVTPLLSARAQARPKITLGVLTDLGGTYRDNTGPNSVACARQAVEEFNPSAHGFDVDVIVADHQNKPDVAASIARQWYDQGVDCTVDVPTSSVALAVAEVSKEKNKIMLNASAASTDVTDKQCSPNTIVWSFDNYMMAVSQGGSIVKQPDGKSWFIITANYVFGITLEEQTTDVVKKGGGTVKGALRYPFPETTDFSSYLQQAQASGAHVLGLANAGADTVNCIKQAHEFGLNKSMKIAPLLIFITDVHSVGPELAAGLNVTTSFYWDYNDRTRAFTKRVLPKLANGTYPNMAHASAYGIVTHYLKTAEAMGAANAKKSGRDTVARMKGIPTDDDAFGKGAIRADGRGEFPAYLWKTKAPAKPGGWDLFEYVSTTPPAQALHPLNPKCEFPVVGA
ncbi:MAG: ABC transporter substrate-binding protein [Acetobacteraceae bacterium]